MDVPMTEITEGIQCECCKDVLYHADELVFFLGDEIRAVTEREPDWDKAICTTCAEEKGLI